MVVSSCDVEAIVCYPCFFIDSNFICNDARRYIEEINYIVMYLLVS